MDTTTGEVLQKIELVMFHQKEKVFSGPFKDIPEFIEENPAIDCVKIYKANGSPILSMKYQDFEKIVEDKFL